MTQSMILAACHGWLRQAARVIYHRLFRFQLRVQCLCSDLVSARAGADGPLPPAMLRFRVSESLSAGEFARIGAGCAKLVATTVAKMGGDIRSAERVLDFGCGCGRTLIWLIREYQTVEFHGADVDREAVSWCRKHLPSAYFATNLPAPPLLYPDQHFGLIYCVSVFTHLNEAMQDAWLAELKRILRPGGFLLITVHGQNATAGLAPADLELLRTTGFLHKQSRKLKGIVPDWYNTTWHSQEYVRARVSKLFPTVAYETVPNGLQDIIIAQAAGAQTYHCYRSRFAAKPIGDSLLEDLKLANAETGRPEQIRVSRTLVAGTPVDLPGVVIDERGPYLDRWPGEWR